MNLYFREGYAPKVAEDAQSFRLQNPVFDDLSVEGKKSPLEEWMKQDEGSVPGDGKRMKRTCAPEAVARTNVYEIYGHSARARGWDFIVHTRLMEALADVEEDLTFAKDGDEVRIIFKRYTKEQIGDVVYE